jgi:FMN phosphatase YigB (HAD superfamily)
MKRIKAKAIAWIDCDDVLVDFKTQFNRYLNVRYGLDIPPNHEPNDPDYDGKLPMSIDWVLQDLPKEWPARLEAFPGAAEFIKTLKKMGCRIVFLTSIDQSCGPYRIKNLNQHGIEFDEIYFTKGLGKGKVAQALRERYDAKFHFFVDDMAKNIVEFSKETQVDALFTLDIPYNQKILEQYPLIQVFKSIDELYEGVVKCLKGILK